MTWKELKDYIDEQLAEQEVSQDTRIECIDIFSPCYNHERCRPQISVDKDKKEMVVFNRWNTMNTLDTRI